MNELLTDFHQDVGRVLQLVTAMSNITGNVRIVDVAAAVDADVAEIPRGDFDLLPGGLLLYIVGRFEYFVRGSFAELAEEVAAKCGTWSELPTRMQASLIEATSTAMLRRTDEEFDIARAVRVLHENINNDSVTEINSNVLSYTEHNLRPEEMSDLFGRIGAKKLWEHVGNKWKMKQHFGNGSPAFAERSAKSRLNAIMIARNSIAHPRKGVTWPSSEQTGNDIKFLSVLADVLYECIEEYKLELTTTPPETA